MKLDQAVAIITGGGAGIGAALVAAVLAEGAAAVVVADRDGDAAAAVAGRHADGAATVVAKRCDVANQADVEALVADTERRFGRIDLVCSNAGLMIDGGLELSAERWERSWAVNVMAHVHAARAAMPGMLARGKGHFMNVCSAAGMLTAPGAAPYAVTKHAALAFAEWLAITYGDQGIGVSALCPEAVRTDMLAASLAANDGVRRLTANAMVLDPEAVAAAAVAGLKAGSFLILPHPRTLAGTQRKWADVGRWLQGMRDALRATA
jgi:NAD(P)-dependent dehydrogenase (short-subunit alcohol dehydrogenase family)